MALKNIFSYRLRLRAGKQGLRQALCFQGAMMTIRLLWQNNDDNETRITRK